MPDKPVAHIENWTELTLFPYGTCLVGRVSKHQNQHHFFSEQQQTSRIININRETKLAETVNTIYTLGEENE